MAPNPINPYGRGDCNSTAPLVSSLNGLPKGCPQDQIPLGFVVSVSSEVGRRQLQDKTSIRPRGVANYDPKPGLPSCAALFIATHLVRSETFVAALYCIFLVSWASYARNAGTALQFLTLLGSGEATLLSNFDGLPKRCPNDPKPLACCWLCVFWYGRRQPRRRDKREYTNSIGSCVFAPFPAH